jgi:hypothetical protein
MKGNASVLAYKDINAPVGRDGWQPWESRHRGYRPSILKDIRDRAGHRCRHFSVKFSCASGIATQRGGSSTRDISR